MQEQWKKQLHLSVALCDTLFMGLTTSRLGANADKVVQELGNIAFFSIGDVVDISPDGTIAPTPVSEWSGETLRALERVQIKYRKKGPDAGKIEKFSVRPYKKMKALELLFKMHEASKKLD